MADAALYKRWKISETLLRRAHSAIPRSESQEERFCVIENAFFEYLEHNEHELALDMLQELGEFASPRGGFWKDLIRAAATMKLAHRIAYFRKKYDEALSHLKEQK